MFIRTGALVFAALLVCRPLLSAPCDSTAVFPVFHTIMPNVAFWVRVFSEYPSTKGILHDERDLNVVYEVIDLLPDSIEDSRELNSLREFWYKEKYRDILENLACPQRPLEEGDLRVASLFGLGADSMVYMRAAQRIRLQIGVRDKFARGLVRSGLYLEAIKSTMRNQGLPEDLAYLPHVESSFRLFIRSKSNALGMWQFISRTGREYMRISRDIDERRDPDAATLAAARLLKRNHRLLGNWPLAITAYNHGVSGVRRATGQVGGGYLKVFKKYQQRGFRFASRNFYSEFLAARYVAKNWKQFFPGLRPAGPWDRIKVLAPAALSLEKICANFGIGMNVLRRNNPALNMRLFAEGGAVPEGYHVYLPGKVVNTLLAAGISTPHSQFSSASATLRFAQNEDGVLEIAGLAGFGKLDLNETNHNPPTNEMHHSQQAPRTSQTEPEIVSAPAVPSIAAGRPTPSHGSHAARLRGGFAKGHDYPIIPLRGVCLQNASLSPVSAVISVPENRTTSVAFRALSTHEIAAAAGPRAFNSDAFMRLPAGHAPALSTFFQESGDGMEPSEILQVEWIHSPFFTLPGKGPVPGSNSMDNSPESPYAMLTGRLRAWKTLLLDKLEGTEGR